MRDLKENIQTLYTSPTRKRLRKILGAEFIKGFALLYAQSAPSRGRRASKFLQHCLPRWQDVLARCTTEELAHGGHDEKDRKLIKLNLFVSIEHLRAKFSEHRPKTSGRHRAHRMLQAVSMHHANAKTARAVRALRLCHDVALLRGDGDLAQGLAALGEVVVGEHAGPKDTSE